jgi:hypothetical protein
MLLVACEPPAVKEPLADIPTGISLSKISFAELPGWRSGNPADALTAWRRSCERILAMDLAAALGGKVAAGTAGDWRRVCSAVTDLSGGPEQVRAFVEANFVPYAVHGGKTGAGLFTGYFEPIVRAAAQPGGAYSVPIHGLPSDHVTVRLQDFDPALAGRSLVGKVEDGRLLRDIVTRHDEQRSGAEPLLVQVMAHGRRLAPGSGSIAQARARAAAERSRLPAPLLALDPAAAPYPVEVSPALLGDRDRAARDIRPGPGEPRVRCRMQRA